MRGMIDDASYPISCDKKEDGLLFHFGAYFMTSGMASVVASTRAGGTSK